MKKQHPQIPRPEVGSVKAVKEEDNQGDRHLELNASSCQLKQDECN